MARVQMAVHIDCEDDCRVTLDLAYGDIKCQVVRNGDVLDGVMLSVGELREIARTLHTMADAATRGDGEE